MKRLTKKEALENIELYSVQMEMALTDYRDYGDQEYLEAAREYSREIDRARKFLSHCRNTD